MLPSCPISTQRVDTNMVRIISFQVALFAIALIGTHEIFFALVLLYDFAVRIFRKPEFSPFHTVAKFIIKLWGISPKLCDESPKRFALFLGFFVSIVLVVLSVAGLDVFVTFIAIILLLCALLETAFDFCIGCKLYYAIVLLKASMSNDRNFH